MSFDEPLKGVWEGERRNVLSVQTFIRCPFRGIRLPGRSVGHYFFCLYPRNWVALSQGIRSLNLQASYSFPRLEVIFQWQDGSYYSERQHLHWLFACPNTYICNNLLTSQLDIKVGTSTTGNLEVDSPSWTLTRLKPCDALSIFQTRVLDGIMLNVQRVHEPADGTYVLRIYASASSFSSSDNRRTAMVTPPPTPFNELAERPPIEFPVVNDFLESNRAARTPAGAGVIDMSDFLLFSSPPDIDIDYFSTIGRGTSRSSSASSSDGAVPSSNESLYTPTLSPASSWSTLEEPVPNRFQLGEYAPAAPMESDSFNAQESPHCVLQDADFSHCTNEWFTSTGSNGRESALTTESSKIPSTSSYFPREPSPGSDSSIFAPTALSAPNPYTTQHSLQPTLPSSAPSPDPHLDSDYDQDNNEASETSGGSCKRRGHFPCLHPSCPRVLTSPYTRSVHMTTHRRAKVRKEFLCTFDGCGEAFTRRHDRARHEVALHGKECAHTCEKCRRFFSSARMLERHACRGRRRDVGNGRLHMAVFTTKNTTSTSAASQNKIADFWEFHVD